MATSSELTQLAKLVRYHILTSTTAAGSGHPTSSMSAADVMTSLFFNHLRFDPQNIQNPHNDRVIFSKGHAAPLLYALYTAAGVITPEENLSLRKMGSPLQGHPMPTFKYSEAATGSLGQGLSIGVGMAINAKYLDKSSSRVFTLLGDGEMAEGSVWEAIEIAAHYKLNNLIGIIDVNRLGQSQQTMFGHDADAFVWRVSSFGWKTVLINGHSPEEIEKAFEAVLKDDGDPSDQRPRMIVAKTNKGHGISFLADKDGWHGKALSKSDLEKALAELGAVDVQKTGTIQKPDNTPINKAAMQDVPPPAYKLGEAVATRKAYGNALARLADKYPDVVAVDGDTKNSTFTEIFAQKKPERFFEMFIAEQNMIGVAAGLGLRGKIPFAATFAAFLTRTYDQLRMAAVSQANFKVAGSHVGVSIGEDGASQMGLEDIAMFRALHGSTIFYPSDAISTEALVEESIKIPGIVYLRTSRPATPVLYPVSEKFVAGGSKTLKSSSNDAVTLIGAGVTLHESLKAYELLQKEGITARVIDLYSVKPVDEKTLKQAAQETKALVVVEDHWSEGGLGDVVLNVLASGHSTPVVKMAVTQMPSSASPEELIEWAGISAKAIVAKVKAILQK